MAVWKKLNPETGEYEVIPSASCNANGGNDEESTGALPDLTGKTAIFVGDSYIYGMSAMLKSMCAEFGMVDDNRGEVSSTICGTVTGSKGTYPMWNRTKVICEEYTAAGTTDDVALIVFMGGANDGFGPSTWIGSGITDTDTEHIYGAMHSLMNDFRKTFPNAKIITVLQPSHYVRTVDGVATDDETAKFFGFTDLAALQKMDNYQISHFSMWLKEKAVQEVAEFYGCSIVDCCFNWYSVMNENDRATYWNSDKLHLSSTGYQEVTKAIREKIIELFS